MACRPFHHVKREEGIKGAAILDLMLTGEEWLKKEKMQESYIVSSYIEDKENQTWQD